MSFDEAENDEFKEQINEAPSNKTRCPCCNGMMWRSTRSHFYTCDNCGWDSRPSDYQ
jgi:predicted RNA-binding Zn-ribbon protein involved in translation (DUF1610 family)